MKKNKMEAITQIINAIDKKESYVLEAGAGAGKTYALIQTIDHLISIKNKELEKKNQNIVCITYTNVAKNEIIERLQNNPLVIVLTIHEFLWDCIKLFNKQLITEFDIINTNKHTLKPDKHTLGLAERISSVDYSDRSFSDFEQGQVGHDDLLTLAKQMFENYELLTSIIASKYPVILIDEYQDTAPEVVSALIDCLLNRNTGNMVLGFYGDSHQKIYDTGVGSLQTYIENGTVNLIKKEENYRSSHNVVKLLNNVRANITQVIPEELIRPDGSVQFINCDNYPNQAEGQNKTTYEKSLVPRKNSNYDKVISKLKEQGWDFEISSPDKILIIANSRVAERGNFGKLYKIFSRRYGQGANDMLLKRESHIISFFTGSMDRKTSIERKTGVEHLVSFYKSNDYGSLSSLLNSNGVQSVNLKKHSNKKDITDILDELLEKRQNGTVKDVYDFVLEKKITSQSLGLIRFIERFQLDLGTLPEDKKARIEKDMLLFNSLMELPFSEMEAFFKHTQNENIFSTKHGTKGEEYRNVLVVIDDTNWKQKYNFEKYFDDTEERPDRKERTKNLFYVSCSRAKENLVVLALSEMGLAGLNTVDKWFETQNVFSINNI